MQCSCNKRIKKISIEATKLEYDEIMFLFNFYKYKLDEELKNFTTAFCVSQKFIPDESARCYEPNIGSIEGFGNSNFVKTPEEIKEEERINKIRNYMNTIERVSPIREGIESSAD